MVVTSIGVVTDLADGAKGSLIMSEPKAAYLPTLFLTKLDDRAWVRRCEFELPNVRSRCSGLSMSNSLERSQSGNLSRSRTTSTWTNPQEHGHSRNPSSDKLSFTPSPSPPKATEPRWTPLPPDSPLLRSMGSFGSTGSLPSTGSLDLDHGYSGLLNLPPSQSQSSLIAPGLSPVTMQLHVSASGSLGRAFGSLLKVPPEWCHTLLTWWAVSSGSWLRYALRRRASAAQAPEAARVAAASPCQRRPFRAFNIQINTQVGWPTGRLRQRQEPFAHSPRG